MREGAVAPAFLLSDYSVRRRRATLAAQLIDLEARLSDAAVQMFDKQVGELFAARPAPPRSAITWLPRATSGVSCACSTPRSTP